MTEVTAAPLVQALEQRRQSFQSLKAVAYAQVVRGRRRLTFDNVGILIKSPEKFRIEAYGPLGTSLFELVWDGKDLFIRRPGESPVRKTGSVLERILGAQVEPRELSAILSGTVPDGSGQDARAFCEGTGCVLELRQGDLLRRIRLEIPAGGKESLPLSYDLYRADALIFRARFEGTAPLAQYSVPRKVVVENPDRQASLTVVYEDIEVNVPVDENAFILSGAEGPGR